MNSFDQNTSDESAVLSSLDKLWASAVAQLVKNTPAVWDIWVGPWVAKIPWRRERLPTPVFWPGELHGLHSPWGHQESDITECLSLSPDKQYFVDKVLHSYIFQGSKQTVVKGVDLFKILKRLKP